MKHFALIAAIALAGCSESRPQNEENWTPPSMEGDTWSPTPPGKESPNRPAAKIITDGLDAVRVYTFTDPKHGCEYIIFETHRGVDSQRRNGEGCTLN